MSKESPTLGAGALVDVRGDRWRVVEMVEHDGCRSCRLVGAAPSNLGLRRTLLAPFDRLRPVQHLSRPRRVGRRRWTLALRSLLAADYGVDGVRGAAQARIDLFDYQLEPALACAGGITRLLLADEVGLGKTIQAGLILADLCARSESVHALIICPAGLCAQWQHELQDRFGLHAELADLAALRRRVQSSLTGAGPWDQMAIALASVDFVKQPEILLGMGHLRWDLLVLDEAHLCALAPERSAAVNWLARRATRVVLMTATPHPGEAGAFEALCRIGRLPGEGPLLMFRRTRAGLGRATARHCHVLAVGLSPVERRMHVLLERYTSRVWESASVDRSRADTRLAMIVLRKRAASGAWSLLTSLTRRLHWLGRPDDAAAAQLLLPFGDDEGPGTADDEPWRILAAPGLTDLRAEHRILETLIDLARSAVEHDSKCRALVRFLRRAGEPAVVFTEYRDTLSRLAGVLGRRERVVVVHGGMDRVSRAESVAAFTRGAADLLLATDAAAHGLNLQARCRLVVDLELPWNPVRLEQRIGRVDRIGQRRTVHAVHLVARGTSEERVLARLALRIRRTREALAIGENPSAVLSEIEVAERVFARGSVLSRSGTLDSPAHATDTPTRLDEHQPESVVPADFSALAREEAARLQRIRQLVRHRGHEVQDVLARLDRSGPWCTKLRLRAWFPCRGTVVALFRAGVIDGRGSLLEQFLVAMQCKPPASSPDPFRGISVPVEEDLTAMAALRAEAERCACGRLAELRATVAPRLALLRAREIGLAAVGEGATITACQPGLFDRRALREADEDRQARALRQEEGQARLDAISRAGSLSLTGPPRLMLIGALERRGLKPVGPPKPLGEGG
jgi:superfamily II DNA or RNA helicase